MNNPGSSCLKMYQRLLFLARNSITCFMARRAMHWLTEKEPHPKVNAYYAAVPSSNQRECVIPQHVDLLYKCYWTGKSVHTHESLPTLEEVRQLSKTVGCHAIRSHARAGSHTL